MNDGTISFDVIIIGSSYAGLAAAMALGRARRSVLILDSGKPCNRQTPHAHNLITHDGDTPAEITGIAKEQVLAYPAVQFVEGKAAVASGVDGAFEVADDIGETYRAKKLLLATGMRDIPLPVDGFAECWGISVLHCPYCHGYEVADAPLGVIGNGDMGFEYARLISNWSGNLTLFTNGRSTLNDEQLAKLKARNIPIIEGDIGAMEHESGHLHHLLFKDGSRYQINTVFSKSTTTQHNDLAVQLGCEIQSEGMFAGLIKVDSFGKTTAAGVYAAGDNCSPMRSLASAISAGTTAGAFINNEMVAAAF